MLLSDWGIPSTTGSQTAPWCGSGRHPPGCRSSRVSLVPGNGQSLRCDQIWRYKKKKRLLIHFLLWSVAVQWRCIKQAAVSSIQLQWKDANGSIETHFHFKRLYYILLKVIPPRKVFYPVAIFQKYGAHRSKYSVIISCMLCLSVNIFLWLRQFETVVNSQQKEPRFIFLSSKCNGKRATGGVDTLTAGKQGGSCRRSWRWDCRQMAGVYWCLPLASHWRRSWVGPDLLLKGGEGGDNDRGRTTNIHRFFEVGITQG